LAPQRVESLILLDPAMELPPRLADALAHEALRVPTFDTPEDAAAERTRTWPPQAHGLVDEELEAHLVRGDDDRWRWRFSAPACVTAYSELARPAVTPPAGMPTLLVVATRSRAVSPTYVDACRSALGDLLTVARLDCGHQVYLEQASELGELIGQFLSGVPC
jgi:lipase